MIIAAGSVTQGYAEDVEARVKMIIAEHLGVEESQVNLSSDLINDLKADPLDKVGLTMALEEEFGKEIPDNAAEKILTVQDAIDFIKENNEQ